MIGPFFIITSVSHGDLMIDIDIDIDLAWALDLFIVSSQVWHGNVFQWPNT